MGRKTFPIKNIVDMVNEFNAFSKDELVAERRAKNMLLATILHEANGYYGFGYLNANDLKGDATTVGIREMRDDGTWNFDDTDDTRIYYYFH